MPLCGYLLHPTAPRLISHCGNNRERRFSKVCCPEDPWASQLQLICIIPILPTLGKVADRSKPQSKAKAMLINVHRGTLKSSAKAAFIGKCGGYFSAFTPSAIAVCDIAVPRVSC